MILIGLAEFKAAAGYASQFQKSGLFTTAVAYAGKPLAWDLSKSDGALHEKHKDECKGPLFYLRKYVLTWGNVLGAAGMFLSGLIGRFIPSGEEGGGKGKMALMSLLSLGGLVGIGASIWGSASGKVVDHFVKGPERDAKIGAELLKVVEKSLNAEEKTALVDHFLNPEINPLRYNEGDEKFITGYLHNPEKPALGFFVGKSGTGKTKAMEWITANIIAHEKKQGREAEVWQVSGQKLQEIINGKIKEGDSKVGLLNEAISLAGSMAGVDPSMAQGVLSQMRENKIKLLRGVLYNIKSKLDEAKAGDPPKRLVIQIDEIDNLFDVAKEDGKYNEDFVNDISGLLGELFEEKMGYDILMTSNLTVDELCGLGTNFKEREELERSKLAKAHGRLSIPTVCHTFEVPNPETSPKIFSVYVKNNSDHFESKFLSNGEKQLAADIKAEFDRRFPPLKSLNFYSCKDVKGCDDKLEESLLRLALDRLEGRGIEGIVGSLIKQKKPGDKINKEMFIAKVEEFLIKERIPSLDRNDPVYKEIIAGYQKEKTHITQREEDQARRNTEEFRLEQAQERMETDLLSKAPSVSQLIKALDDVNQEQIGKLGGMKEFNELIQFLESVRSGQVRDLSVANIKARGYLVAMGFSVKPT